MLHAYLLVDGARNTKFYPRQNSEFCQLKRWFYQSVKSIRHHENPESWCSVTASEIVNAYGGTGKNHPLLIFYLSFGLAGCACNKKSADFIYSGNKTITPRVTH